ncbi:MAG: NUDIX domain-containing protein [Candidatus Liptonbacteria bacterium]|nr:NUDIX domain-containing protein [Candidatus Liptonbacteria bacterium]
MPHIHEKIDFTVEVFVVHKNTVLLRKHDKYKMWLSVGGHIELDEDPNQAALREVKEEVGLDVALAGKIAESEVSENFRELLAPRFLNRHRIHEAHEHVTMVYFSVSPTNKISQGKTEVSDELRWFTAEELDDPQYGLRDNIRFYARKALDELG